MVETVKKITRNGEHYFYGTQVCLDANDAYCRFRDDYHACLGKRVYRRLNMPEREERIHGFRVYYSEEVSLALDAEFGAPSQKIPFRLMGLVGLSYCRGFDGSVFPDLDDESFERWFDWFLLHGHEMMRQIGRNEKVGRTSRNKRRYR